MTGEEEIKNLLGYNKKNALTGLAGWKKKEESVR